MLSQILRKRRRPKKLYQTRRHFFVKVTDPNDANCLHHLIVLSPVLSFTNIRIFKDIKTEEFFIDVINDRKARAHILNYIKTHFVNIEIDDREPNKEDLILLSFDTIKSNTNDENPPAFNLLIVLIFLYLVFGGAGN